jgi:hypothetical protein
MRGFLFVAATSFALIISLPAHAGLNFDFSFTDTVGNTSGTVTGEIIGLADNGTSAATDLVIDGYPAGLSLSAVPWDIFNDGAWFIVGNSFTVSGGEIIAANFFDSGPGEAIFSLDNLGFNTLEDNGLPPNVTENAGGFAGVTYTAVPAVVPTPEPVSIALLLSGLFGLRLIRRRRG